MMIHYLMRALRRSWLVLLAVLILSASSQAQFYELETDNIRLVYYGKAQEYLVSHTARCMENSLKFHKALFDYTPSEKITLLMHDMTDYGNAGAGTSPFNSISMAVAPVSYALETTPGNERINSTLNHETVHIVACDKAAGRDRVFRSLFSGKVPEISDQPVSLIYSYLTAPRRSAPRWYHEGIAVFLETWMAGGLGRVLGPYDEMAFRTLVRDSGHIYDRVGLESEGTKIDFQITANSYLYGSRLFSYLALHHGPESLIQWVSRSPGSSAHFASQFSKVYSESLDKVWSDWIEWEREFQEANLASIREYPITPYREVCDWALGSVSRAHYDSETNQIYVAVNYPGQVAHLAAIDMADGSVERLQEVKGAALYYVTSTAYDQEGRTLFFTTDNNEWRDIMALDLSTGKTRRLLKDARVGDLAFSQDDKSLWGVRHFNGISTLVRIPHPYEEWNQVYSFPYGRDIYDIDVSPDGEWLSAGLSEISGRNTLVMIETSHILMGDTTYVELFDFGNSTPANFAFARDGSCLYGSSYYTGVSNIFRYDFVADSMEAVTNCETGMFRPVPLGNDSLLSFRYSAKGFVPVVIPDLTIEDVNPAVYLGQKIVEQHPIVKEWMIDPPSAIDLDTLKSDSGEYHGLSHLSLAALYPIVEGYGDYPAYGVHMDLRGPINLHKFGLTASYTPNQLVPTEERWHGELSYTHMDWAAHLKYNDADFYDLFGPTKSSRKGYSMGLRYSHSLFHDAPKAVRIRIGAVWYGGLRELPEYQNITTSYDRFLTVRTGLTYSNLRASLGAVDFEKGLSCQLMTNTRFVRQKVFTRLAINANVGLALPWHHSSVWLRTSSGYSPNRREEPLANFYFGGFGNNWVDCGSAKRYRAFYSFPGVELNAVGGTTYGKAMLEWALPPLRFRHIGLPWFYATWAQLAVFSTGLITNFDADSERRELANAGAQLDIRLLMLSHLNFTLSAGYAAAFEEHRDIEEEWMVSVKIL